MRNVVILGMHRSGTSMVAEALASAGVYVGEPQDLLLGQEDNPHGFWEREDVVALDDAILADAGAAWYRPPQGTPRATAEQEQAIAAIIAGMPADRSWLIKDPRQVLTWSAWEGALDDAVVVFVYRDALAVAASLQRRNHYPLAFGLRLWEYYNRLALAAIKGRDAVCLSYEAVAKDPREALGGLLAELAERGVSCERQFDENVFDVSLGHSRAADDTVAQALLEPSQRQLMAYCEALCGTGELPPLAPMPQNLRPLLQDLGSSLEPLATVLETRIEIEERVAERDKILGKFRQLDTEHAALSDAHIDEVARHKKLEGHYTQLKEEHDAVKPLYMAMSSSLLQFELSSLARIWGFVAWCYKLVTLRRGVNTSYDDALADAAAIYRQYELAVPRRPPSKLAMLGDMLKYAFENPAGSARSFSFARLKRAATVIFSSTPDDLEVWVNSRFPEREAKAGVFDVADLDARLDHLEMTFPAVDSPLVSIIVPVYNDYRVTKNCLQSVLKNTGDIPYELIIADDCSTDLTASITERVGNIKVVRGERNLRFLGNCNQAAGAAAGKYMLFLNNDTAVFPGWLEPLVEVLESDPQVGIVGPKLLFANGKLQEAGAIMWRDGSAWNFGRMDDPEKPEYNYLKETDYISGACLLLRAGLWLQLGGFDQRYAPAYYEDADIAFAARAAGYKVVYQPLSQVYHFEGVSNGTDLASGVKQYQVQNQAKFREKWARQLDEFHFPNAENVFWARDRSRAQRCVLFIDHYVPHFDKDAGSRSTFMYVQLMLEMGYKVIFLGANYFPHKPYTQTLQQLGVEVLVGEHMARHQDRWLQENAPYIDCVYLHRPHVAEQFLGSLEKMQPRPKVIFFGHDLHYLRIDREQQVTGEASLEKTALKWRKREYAVFDRVDKIYYPSQVEVDEIHSQRPELDVRAIPLYIMDARVSGPYNYEETADILFVGGFNHPPNVDGICWFVEEVLPLVVHSCPDIRLHVVGSNPTDAVDALQSERVVVYGYLSDAELDALYRRVRQVIVPLRFGAGVKGKVLEAIQKNLPLVTTSVGAEGIPDAESVMNMADDAQAFAAAIIRIDSGDAAALARLQGYPTWLQTNFSRDNAASVIEEDFGSSLRPEPVTQQSGMPADIEMAAP